MKACVIHKDNLGNPRDVFVVDSVPEPVLSKDDEVIVKIHKTCIGHNTSWIARGVPVNVVRTERHIAGSGATGVVFKSNSKLFKPGDNVFITCNYMINKTLRILGYETPGGTFAELCCVKDYMCHQIPEGMNENAGAAFNNIASSWQMLFGWEPNVVKPGDVVLIWGGSGSIGSVAIHLVQKHGGIPIVVTSSETKRIYCESIGARAVLNRNDYKHLCTDDTSDRRSMIKFISDVRKITGKLPQIVFEHTGANTLPTSITVCDNKGMVVLCGATTGYEVNVDVRKIWVPQKRFQGSHYYDTRHTLKIINECKDSAFDVLTTSNGYTLNDIGELTSQMEECPGDKILNNIIIDVA